MRTAAKKKLAFKKMAGTGNDFIMIDDRKLTFPADNAELIRALCRRQTGIGADGVILLQPSEKHVFFMRIFNADGSQAEMCGNGSRCVAVFARGVGAVHADRFVFETLAGPIQAQILPDGNVSVGLSEPKDLRLDLELDVDGQKVPAHFINTGVPHAVLFDVGFDAPSIVQMGRSIRRHKAFAPAGTNVNFVRVTGHSSIQVRTYERGVEDETLACGTGMTASSIISCLKENVRPPVAVTARGGDTLKVDFKLAGKQVSDVWLTGAVQEVFEGALTL